MQKSGRGGLWEVATFISDFTDKILIFWKFDRLWELVAHGRSTEFHFNKTSDLIWFIPYLKIFLNRQLYQIFKKIVKGGESINYLLD